MSLVASRCIACKQSHHGAGLQCDACRAGKPHNKAILMAKECAPFPGRLVISVPWTALSSDNNNVSPLGKEGSRKKAAYEAAKALFRQRAQDQYAGQPCPGPCRVSCLIFVPDNAARDATFNFSKIVGDGLKGIVIADDRWQVTPEVSFKVGGIDRDAPRCLITVEAL